MQSSTNLKLHHRILLSLSQHPAKSIAALARDLETLRPSMSRAVRSLLEKQLVVKNGRSLYLTEQGEREVALLKETLPERAKHSSELVTTAIEQANKSLEQVSRFSDIGAIAALQPQTSQVIATLTSAKLSPFLTIQPAIAKALYDFAAVQRSIDATLLMPSQAVAQSIMQLQSNFDNRMFQQLQETMHKMAHVQSINIEWLQSFKSPLAQVLVENNTLISNMISDISALSRLTLNLAPSLCNLIKHVGNITDSYEAYYIDLGKRLDIVANIASGFNANTIIPTVTTSTVISSVRSIVYSQADLQETNEKPTVLPMQQNTYNEQQYITLLSMEQYLSPVGDRFIRKWRGAWQTISSSSEDRHSQALHSGRELLMQLLEQLAPDSVFTAEDLEKNNVKRPTRRMRAKYILNGSQKATDWVEKVAAAIDASYDIFAAESHSHDDTTPIHESAIPLLSALGNLMTFLLQNREESH